MCGILGKIGASCNQIRDDHFLEALSLLTHRGPDDFGYSKGESFFFGQRRLSIIDLSKGGKQPQYSKSNGVTIVYNGEIYNYKEIRSILTKKGHKFETNSDTEVLLNAFIEYGIECLNYLIGMFAFAIHDEKKKESYLVRDRLGIKPLYYFNRGKNITFASEIKAILKLESDYNFKYNQAALSSYMSFRYPILNDTFFDEIKVLPAAHYLKFENGSCEIKEYWTFDNFIEQQQQDLGEEYYINELQNLLTSSVKYRMNSDVPLGSFLSGGVDSSAVTAILAQSIDEPVNTFTIGFKEKGYNEFNFASEVANQYQTNHKEILLSGEDYLDTMDWLIEKKDAPLSVPNEVPLYLMSKELKKDITVVLSGEGADEIFGGYGRLFRSTYDHFRIGKLDQLGLNLAEKASFSELYNKKYKGNKFSSELEHFYFLYSYTSENDKNNLLTKDFSNEHIESRLKQHIQGYFDRANSSYLNKIMYTFEKLHLQGLLNRVDTATMAASVEARVPFVDHRLVEFAFSIPLKYKLKWKSESDRTKSKILLSDEISEKHDTPKYILKKAFESRLSNNILYRKKMGFPVPLNDWFGGKFKDYAKSILLDKSTLDRGQLNKKSVESWINSPLMKKDHKYAMKIWMLVNNELFNRKYFS